MSAMLEYPIIGQFLHEISKSKPHQDNPYRMIGSLFHVIGAALGASSVWALKALELPYESRIPFPNDYFDTAFCIATGGATLFLGADLISMKDGQSSKTILKLSDRLATVATLVNAVSMAALLYLGAPFWSRVGIGLVFYTSSFLYDIFRSGNERSMIKHAYNQLTAGR